MSETLSRRAVLTGAVRGTLPEEETFDVVVVGSGAAGLAAALEARKAGAEVIVLEKMGSIGGNSVISQGLAAVPGTPQQSEAGIGDNPELMFNDLMKVTLRCSRKTPLPPGSGQSMSSAFTGAGAWNTTTATRSGAAWRLPIRVRAL